MFENYVENDKKINIQKKKVSVGHKLAIYYRIKDTIFETWATRKKRLKNFAPKQKYFSETEILLGATLIAAISCSSDFIFSQTKNVVSHSAERRSAFWCPSKANDLWEKRTRLFCLRDTFKRTAESENGVFGWFSAFSRSESIERFLNIPIDISHFVVFSLVNVLNICLNLFDLNYIAQYTVYVYRTLHKCSHSKEISAGQSNDKRSIQIWSRWDAMQAMICNSANKRFHRLSSPVFQTGNREEIFVSLH